jgi:hypothetical protein
MTGEVEVEGSPELVSEWWDKLWPQLSEKPAGKNLGGGHALDRHSAAQPAAGSTEVPEVFGEFFNDFRPDVTDVDKMLIAGAFVQARDPDRTFTTKDRISRYLDERSENWTSRSSPIPIDFVSTKRAPYGIEYKFWMLLTRLPTNARLPVENLIEEIVMTNSTIRVRANRMTGEVEVEGSPELVSEWWDKLWPQLSEKPAGKNLGGGHALDRHSAAQPAAGSTEVPEVFGEFFNDFRPDVTDVDKMLIAGAFVQARDPDRTFTTKNANQLLMDQNLKLTNASECVRRLIMSKRAFVVGEGKFRVSAQGLERLKSLKPQPAES